MKISKILLVLFVPLHVWAQDCSGPVDLVAIGDSQSGAAWSRSSVGSFLSTCLKGNFVMYGRSGTVPNNWLGSGGMDHVETIQRTPVNTHLNIGVNIPECKKRIGPMLKAHKPKKLLIQFGSNMASSTDEAIKAQVDLLMKTVGENGITSERCYFLTSSYEMEVESRRNLPDRNLATFQRMNKLIKEAVGDRCKIISGLELMKDSPYFDGKELLYRRLIPGLGGCGGAAVNDNVHICGEAARDLAERACHIINQ